jgi:hypothetical protein
VTLFEEMRRGVRGAWLLLRRDPGWAAWFNVSVQGFWRSFFAAIVLLPIYYLYHEFNDTDDVVIAVPLAQRWAAEAIGYVLGWTLWPLIAHYLTRAMDCGDRFIAYIVAFNWGQMIGAPFLIGLTLLVKPLLPEDVWLFVFLPALLGVLAFEYLIARQALAIAPARAVAVEAAVFAVSLLLRDLTLLVAQAGAVA